MERANPRSTEESRSFVAEHFNPYHQWLGLGPHIRSPNPSQLLGVKSGENDVEEIRRAAERAQQRVRSYSPGPRVADWSRLLAEIESAKDALIARAGGTAGGTVSSSGKGTYRRPAPRARSSSGTASSAGGTSPKDANAVPRVPVKGPDQYSASPPMSRPAPQTTPAPSAGATSQYHPGSGYPVPPEPQGTARGVQSVQPVAGSRPSSRLRTRSASKARRSRRSNQMILLACGLGTLMLVIGIFLPVFVAMTMRSSERSAATGVAEAEAPAVIHSPTRPSTIPSKTRPHGDDRVRSVDPTLPDRSVPGASELDSTDAEPEGATSRPPVAIEPIELVPSFGRDPIGDQPLPDRASELEIEPRPPSGDHQETGPADESEKPESEIGSPPASSVPLGGRGQPTEQQIQELSDTLAGARRALEANRHDDALESLAEIHDLPMREEDFQRFQRLQLLVQYSRNFRDELVRAIAALQGGDEINVGDGSVVGVVEADRDWVTVRVAGVNRTYRLDALPAGLAIAIADLRLADTDPVSLVVKAAHLASRDDLRDDQRRKAREWFRSAKQQGVDIGDLEKVLDDN